MGAVARDAYSRDACAALVGTALLLLALILLGLKQALQQSRQLVELVIPKRQHRPVVFQVLPGFPRRHTFARKTARTAKGHTESHYHAVLQMYQMAIVKAHIMPSESELTTNLDPAHGAKLVTPLGHTLHPRNH